MAERSAGRGTGHAFAGVGHPQGIQRCFLSSTRCDRSYRWQTLSIESRYAGRHAIDPLPAGRATQRVVGRSEMGPIGKGAVGPSHTHAVRAARIEASACPALRPCWHDAGRARRCYRTATAKSARLVTPSAFRQGLGNAQYPPSKLERLSHGRDLDRPGKGRDADD